MTKHWLWRFHHQQTCVLIVRQPGLSPWDLILRVEKKRRWQIWCLQPPEQGLSSHLHYLSLLWMADCQYPYLGPQTKIKSEQLLYEHWVQHHGYLPVQKSEFLLLYRICGFHCQHCLCRDTVRGFSFRHLLHHPNPKIRRLFVACGPTSAWDDAHLGVPSPRLHWDRPSGRQSASSVYLKRDSARLSN